MELKSGGTRFLGNTQILGETPQNVKNTQKQGLAPLKKIKSLVLCGNDLK